MIERTLVLLKPDAVERSITGQIITRLEQAGLKIIGMKMVWVDKDFSKKHYEAHVKKHFYKSLETFIISGPVIAMAVEGLHAVEVVRKIVGPTEPRTAPSGTIRGDFAVHSYEYTDKKKISIKNLIHASGNKSDAKKEVNLWFKKEEMHSYKTVHEKHVC